MKPRKQMWVHPDFKRMMERKKGETGDDMIDLTRDIANGKHKKKNTGGGFFDW